MKYLVCFRPGEYLARKIESTPSTTRPKLGFHSTVYLFSADSRNEWEILERLKKIKFKKFDVKTLDCCCFDEDSQVLKLNKPHQLTTLHDEIVNTLNGLVITDERYNKYIGKNYSPHITIGKGSQGFDTTNRKLIGITVPVVNLEILKKEDVWRKIGNIY
ncbi:hypothetical protein JXB27_03160 [Candidatus Woesearchaeota archaeon]|nr:hypothetical protein [Candidatus Woesearchaeota archaeon]